MVIGTRVEYLSVENWDVFRERNTTELTDRLDLC